ncbi:hypothetical protein KY289_015218 [Solanum tuberosum]|nr:hypothetical protein KY289_015218 [Solanum tuberosum]KAH0700765.1 hypothetical protein KY284_014980 [Solanum tuberosum]
MEELEERMHQRMAEKLEQQKVTIHQEVTNDILGRLNLGAQSPQEAMQPLNRPSSSKNHQGGEDNEGDDESSDEDLIT